MRAFVAFIVYFFGCLLLAAILVPWVQPWLQSILGDGATPSRTLYRFAMLLALVGFPWFLRTQQLNSWHLVGYTLPMRQAWMAIGKGLLYGILILLVLVIGLLLVDAREIALRDDFSAGRLIKIVITGLVSGLLVGVIEETFFRGMMHTGMRRSLGFWPTALIISAFYAAVHFIRPMRLPENTPLTLSTSLDMALQGIARLMDFATIADSFFALLMAGLLLSMVRERTGSILWTIGIHAGWVAVIKTTKHVTDARGGESFWIGSYDQITGWMAALWLILLSAWYWRQSRR